MEYERTKSDWPDELIENQYEHFLARHSVEGPTIDAKPRGKRISEWTFKDVCCVLFAMAVVGLLAPWVILIGGLSMMALWDAITRL